MDWWNVGCGLFSALIAVGALSVPAVVVGVPICGLIGGWRE